MTQQPKKRERCWAASVSDCSEKRSKEHPFTRGMWPSLKLDVSGEPWGEKRTVGIEALVVRSLCKKHNEELSDLDQAGVDFINAVRRIRTMSDRIDKTRTRYRLDGRRIEAWLFKMLMGAATMMRKPLNDWRLPDEVAQYIFGAQTLPKNCGMGFLAQVHERLDHKVEGLSLRFGKQESEPNPSAAFIRLWGYPILMSWTPQTKPFLLAGRVYSVNDYVVRPKRVNYKPVGTRLDFQWTKTVAYRPDNQLVQLRGRWTIAR